MKILNSKGEEIVLNGQEKKIADYNTKLCNALGHEVDITTMTLIQKQQIDQKFFTVRPSDFFPVKVGEGAFSTSLLTYKSYDIGDDFEKGFINTGANNSKLSSADAGVEAVTNKIFNWGKEIGYNIIELAQASRSGNWDLVAAKERSRKRNYDLGVQKIAFLGSADGKMKGLLNQTSITPELTIITKAIKDMTFAELKVFTNKVLTHYRSNCKFTAWPSHFAIPETDFLGLAGASNPEFPIKSVLDVLLETFRTMTGNPNFQIKPLAYLESANSGLGKQRYVLFNSSEDTLRMDVPVDYTATLANTVNGFSYQNVAYAQLTGVIIYRPLEVVYFEY